MSDADQTKKSGGGWFRSIIQTGFEVALVVVLVTAFLGFPKVMRWLNIDAQFLDPTTFAHTFLYKAAHLSAANLLVWIMLEFFYPTFAGYIRKDNNGPTFKSDFASLPPLARTLILLGLVFFQLIYILLIL